MSCEYFVHCFYSVEILIETYGHQQVVARFFRPTARNHVVRAYSQINQLAVATSIFVHVATP